ncbi:unnamed protein product, partial [Adineta steineri]
MFDDIQEPPIDEEGNPEENLIDEARSVGNTSNITDQPTTSTPTSPYYLSHA